MARIIIEKYREEIVQWARSFNCLLSDLVSACTVEENPYRYAVRFPGYMGKPKSLHSPDQS